MSGLFFYFHSVSDIPRHSCPGSLFVLQGWSVKTSLVFLGLFKVVSSECHIILRSYLAKWPWIAWPLSSCVMLQNIPADFRQLWGEDDQVGYSGVVLSLKNRELVKELVLEATNEHKHVSTWVTMNLSFPPDADRSIYQFKGQTGGNCNHTGILSKMGREVKIPVTEAITSSTSKKDHNKIRAAGLMVFGTSSRFP